MSRRSERVRRGTLRSSATRPGGKGKTPARPRLNSSTGGAFQLSSTRRASVLAILVCAMALSVSVPLRTYVSQQEELEAQEKQKTQMLAQVDRLEKRRAELSDPVHVEAEARARLGLVRPGETPYIVQVPPMPKQPPPPKPEPKEEDDPWYQDLWEWLTRSGS